MTDKKIRHNLKPSELILGSQEFKELCQESEFEPDLRAWFNVWENLNLMQSPMDDNLRKWYRLGHYVGWFDHIHKSNNAEVTKEEATTIVDCMCSSVDGFIDKFTEEERKLYHRLLLFKKGE